MAKRAEAHTEDTEVKRIARYQCPECKYTGKFELIEDARPCEQKGCKGIMEPLIMRIKLDEVRVDDGLPDEIEIDMEADIAKLMLIRSKLDTAAQIDDRRAVAAAIKASKSRSRLLQFDGFLQDKYKEFVAANAPKGKKSADCNLEAIGHPEITIRIQQRTSPQNFEIDDDAVIEYWTKDATPTTKEAGPCVWVPGYWKVNKLEAKSLFKEKKFPGVKELPRTESCTAREQALAVKEVPPTK